MIDKLAFIPRIRWALTVAMLALPAWAMTTVSCVAPEDTSSSNHVFGVGGAGGTGGNHATSSTECIGFDCPGACAANPRPGCACDAEGELLACGQVEIDVNGQSMCGKGYSTCTGGKWGECVINNAVTLVPDPGSESYAMNFGSPVPCTTNPCQPGCIDFPDTPTNIPDAGPGVVANDAGVSLVDGGITTPNCVPKTCNQLSINCGPASDTCGGLLHCGTCSVGYICGAGGPNRCGSSVPCVSGLCTQQTYCANNNTTSISGIVYAPNGADPLPNVNVYVPDSPVAPFPTTISCDNCTQASGDPLISTTTATNGWFKLDNMPVGTNIPLVIQVGRWRRQITIPSVPACVNTPLTMAQTRLPKNKSEGDIPKMAIVTGGVDAMECVFNRIGIDYAEVTNQNQNGRIHLYAGYQNWGHGIVKYGSGGTEWENVLLSNLTKMKGYDIILFPCQGTEAYDYDYAYWDGMSTSYMATMYNNIAAYANAGGRIFATHYSYRWLYNGWAYSSVNSPFKSALNWNINNWATDGTLNGFIDTSFPKGALLADWLKVIYPASTWGQIPVSVIRKDFNSVAGSTQRWMTVNSPLANTPIHATFNTPLNAQPQNQCGRVVFSDFHVENANTKGYAFPTACPGGAMTAQEKLLEFMLFDLASCVEPDDPGLVCTPSTCAQQGLSCGPAGDGCGNTIQCGTCTAPQTCGGAGIPGKCGAAIAYTDGYFARDYNMSGVCPQGHSVQWNLWSWDAVTPGDSKIEFQIQSADTAAGLASATKYNLQFSNPPGPAALAGSWAIARATPAPSTQTGSALIDTTLQALNLSRVKPFLRVTSHLVPTTDKTKAPTLKSWNLQADCVPTQ